jgi:hypothetical protein
MLGDNKFTSSLRVNLRDHVAEKRASNHEPCTNQADRAKTRRKLILFSGRAGLEWLRRVLKLPGRSMIK